MIDTAAWGMTVPKCANAEIPIVGKCSMNLHALLYPPILCPLPTDKVPCGRYPMCRLYLKATAMQSYLSGFSVFFSMSIDLMLTAKQPQCQSRILRVENSRTVLPSINIGEKHHTHMGLRTTFFILESHPYIAPLNLLDMVCRQDAIHLPSLRNSHV